MSYTGFRSPQFVEVSGMHFPNSHNDGCRLSLGHVSAESVGWKANVWAEHGIYSLIQGVYAEGCMVIGLV